MTESELRKKINANTAQYKTANDTTKALLMSENESLAKQLDSITGGTSSYDAATNTWDLSASNKGAVDRALELRREIEDSAYGGYDPTTDVQYSALKKEYLREADRGTEDTMGIYAGMTGGMPSSAAVTAAQQAGDYYRGQLADRQVELAAQDYDRYLSELSQKNSLYSQYVSAAEASAQQLAALGDFSAMGKLYGWTDDQIKKAEAAWAASQYTGSGGGSSGSGSSATVRSSTSGAMTVEQWESSRRNSLATGQFTSAAKYPTYEAYLEAYMAGEVGAESSKAVTTSRTPYNNLVADLEDSISTGGAKSERRYLIDLEYQNGNISATQRKNLLEKYAKTTIL